MIDIVKKHSNVGFTGKINILYQTNGQFVGAVFMAQGNLVHMNYKGIQGKKSLASIVLDENTGKTPFRFVPEPEIINPVHISFNFSFVEFKQLIDNLISYHQKASLLRPPDPLKLRVNPDFIIQGDAVNSEELDILSTVISHNQVGNIYLHSSLQEFAITKALVSLRKKKALLVLKENSS